jgi:hypothetical protein
MRRSGFEFNLFIFAFALQTLFVVFSCSRLPGLGQGV